MKALLALVLLAAAPAVGSEDEVAFLRAGAYCCSDTATATLAWSFGSDRRLWTVRFSDTREFRLFTEPEPKEATQDLGVLLGTRSPHAYGSVSASAGLGLVRAVRRGARRPYGSRGPEHETVQRWTLGVPLEVVASLHGERLGVGVEVLANLNTNASFVVFAIVIEAGRLR